MSSLYIINSIFMNFRHTQNVIFVNSDASCGIFKGSGRIYIIPLPPPLLANKIIPRSPFPPPSLLHFWIIFFGPAHVAFYKVLSFQKKKPHE